MGMEIEVALIAGTVSLLGVGVSNFLAEKYKRLNESRALAAAFAGELATATRNYDDARKSWGGALERAKGGETLTFPKLPQQSPTPIFDANVGKVGSLGPDLAGEVAFVYAEIRTFRAGLDVTAALTQGAQQAETLGLTLAAMDRANAAAIPLIQQLRAHAKSSLLWRKRSE